MNVFGENLQFYRKKIEMTQEQLAEQLEVSRQTVSKWEAVVVDFYTKGEREAFAEKFPMRIAAGIGVILNITGKITQMAGRSVEWWP